jgi:hypothetical protein
MFADPAKNAVLVLWGGISHSKEVQIINIIELFEP